jgi:hypothetical protein
MGAAAYDLWLREELKYALLLKCCLVGFYNQKLSTNKS